VYFYPYVMRCMTLCIYLWDVLYAIATDPGTTAMVQGSRFSMKIRGFTATLYGFDSRFLGYAACRRWRCPPSRSTSVEFCGAQNMLLLLVHPVQFTLNFFMHPLNPVVQSFVLFLMHPLMFVWSTTSVQKPISDASLHSCGGKKRSRYINLYLSFSFT
jgi:hypothetical protein